MSFVRFLARPMLASSFVLAGVDKLKNADDTAEQLSPLLRRAAESLPFQTDEKVLARVIGGAQVGAGVFFALGKSARLAATILAVVSALNSFVEWRSADICSKEGRDARRKQLLKNVSLTGGVLLASVDTAGTPQPGMAGRAPRRRRQEERGAPRLRRQEDHRQAVEQGRQGCPQGRRPRDREPKPDMTGSTSPAATASGPSKPSRSEGSPHWQAPYAERPVDATVTVPGSKSLTNRYLVLAALADGPSRLRAPLHSRDSALMIEALRQLGATITEVPGDGAFGPDLEISPISLAAPAADTEIDCGLAGTVMRFVPPVAALRHGTTLFDGDPHARKRPMGTIIEALTGLGVGVGTADGAPATSLPFTVQGTGEVRGGHLVIDASASSQFVSALLLAGARFTEGLHLEHAGPPGPQPGPHQHDGRRPARRGRLRG